MLLNNFSETETNCTLPSTVFSIKNSPVAFDILSSKLYANPMKAIIRELISNAYDSHQEAGTLDKAIDIHAPSKTEPNFVIRDYGTGLSEEAVKTLYTTFFDSTKSEDNTYTGCFGLGSKTPFSYGSSFTVTSFYKGMKHTFLATKNKGYPSIIEIGKEETEEHNGLQINIPVQAQDVTEFNEELQNYLECMSDININAQNFNVKYRKRIAAVDNVSCYSNESMYSFNALPHYSADSNDTLLLSDVSIKQGRNIFPLENICRQAKLDYKQFGFLQLASFCFDIVIEVPIGTFAVVPSREFLAATEENITAFKTVLTDAKNKLLHFFSKAVTGPMPADFADKRAWLNIKHVMLSMQLRSKLQGLYLSAVDWLIPRFDIVYEYSDTGSYTTTRYNANRSPKTNVDFTLYHNIGDFFAVYHTAKEDWSSLKEHRLSLYENDRVLLLICNHTIDSSTKRKIRNIVSNYPELSEKYNKLLFIPFPETKSRRNNLRKFLMVLKELTICNIHVDRSNVNKFLRSYPNHRAKRKEGKTARTAEEVAVSSIYYANIYLNAGYISCPCTRDMNSIAAIKKRYEPEHTVLFTDCPFCDLKYPVHFLRILKGVSYIADETTVLVSMFKDMYGDTAESITNLLYVSQKNIRYFKEYHVITMKDILEYIKAHPVQYYTGSVNYNDIVLLKKFESIVKTNYPEKVADLILQSNASRKIQILNRIFSKYSSMKHSYSMDWISNKPSDLSSYLSQFEITYDECFVPSKLILNKLVSRNIHKILEELRNTSRRKKCELDLPRDNRQRLLNKILNRRKPNVLFQK